MEITISAIHCTIPESLHDHAARLARRLDRYELRVATLKLSFEKINGVRAVEARLSSAGNTPFIAHGGGPTYRSAMNQVFDRVERQIKRTRSRRREHRRKTTVAE
jgi:ribosomal subunit interface protein